MRRREFITLLGGTGATWPLAARAQQPAGRVYRVGYLSIASRERSLRFVEAFEDGLRRLGYRVGETVIFEYRFADGQMERGLDAEELRTRLRVLILDRRAPTAKRQAHVSYT